MPDGYTSRGKPTKYLPQCCGCEKELGPTGRVKPGANRYHMPTAGRGLLYRLPEVLAGIADGAVIYWTEGERDADTLAGAGLVATTHPNGAAHATEAHAEFFRGFGGLVVLIYDHDPDEASGWNAGVACALKRYDLLRGVGVRDDQIALGRPPEAKDVTDHYAAGLTVEGLVWSETITPAMRRKAQRRAGSETYPRSLAKRGAR